MHGLVFKLVRMAWKPLLVATVAAAAVVLTQSPRAALAWTALAGIVLAVAILAKHALAAVIRPTVRGSMLASGIVVAAGMALPWLPGGHSIDLGLLFLLLMPGVFAALPLAMITLFLDGAPQSVAAACVAVIWAVYWVVNTAVLGALIEVVRRRRGDRLAACMLALTLMGCLTDTPPKTPNQRDAERNAPVVSVPPPPDAGRTPRPAPQ